MQVLSSDSDGEHENGSLHVSEEALTIEDVIQPFTNLKVDGDIQGNDTLKFFPNQKLKFLFEVLFS